MSYTGVSVNATGMWADSYYWNGYQNIYYMSNYAPHSYVYVDLHSMNDYINKDIISAKLYMNNYSSGRSGYYPTPHAVSIINQWSSEHPTNPLPIKGVSIGPFDNTDPFTSVDISNYIRTTISAGQSISGVALGFSSEGSPNNFYAGQFTPQASVAFAYADGKDDIHVYAMRTETPSTVILYATIDPTPGKPFISEPFIQWSLNGSSYADNPVSVTNLNGSVWYTAQMHTTIYYTIFESEQRLEYITFFNPSEPYISQPFTPSIKMLNNYGKFPLTVYIEDESTFPIGFVPKYWVWKISNGSVKTGKRIDVSIVEPGTYDISLSITDGITVYTASFNDVIFVVNNESLEGTQIELAHNSSENAMRHLLKTKHTFNASNSNVSVSVWNSSDDITALGSEEMFILQADNTCRVKNLLPFVSDAFRVGEDDSKWRAIKSIISESELNQSKSLRLWGGK